MTEERFIEAQEGNEGYCTQCREFTTDSCEPDARGYVCDECGEKSVFGAEEALMMGLIEFTEEEDSEDE